MEPHSDVLRRFSSDIQRAIAYPGGAASMLYQEGVVFEDVVGEVVDSAKPCSEKNAAIMRAVGAAVGADPKKLWVFIAVLEKFTEFAPVAPSFPHVLSWYCRCCWIEICEATHSCHCKKIIHRDLQPENVLLDGRRRVKLGGYNYTHCNCMQVIIILP